MPNRKRFKIAVFVGAVGKAISVTASYTDGQGTAESRTSEATTAIANVNDAPTGSVTISGTPKQGQTLTAGSTLADIDGLGTIGYQWKAGDTLISGATGSTFVLTQAEVGKAISVTASYTDGQGTAESVSSTATTAVVKLNSAPVIGGIPATAQAVTTGTAAALADFTVSDVDNNTLTVTLNATNGTIKGLTDVDSTIPGIQLSGTAAAINSAIAAATFTATAAGSASIGISVTDGEVIQPVTATYNLTAVNPIVPPTIPPKIFLTIDSLYTLAGHSQVYGNTGTETLQIIGTPDVGADQNIERIELDSLLASYGFQQQGNRVIINKGSLTVGTVTVQGDADGTTIAFSDGSAQLKLTGTILSIGNQALSQSGLSPISPAQLGSSFNTHDVSKVPAMADASPVSFFSAESRADVLQLVGAGMESALIG